MTNPTTPSSASNLSGIGNGSQPQVTWAQIQALVTPPPLPTASDSTDDSSSDDTVDSSSSVNAGGAPNVDPSVVNSILSTQPTPTAPDMSGEPVTPDQQKQILADEQSSLAIEKSAYDKYQTDLDAATTRTDELTQAEINALSAPPPAPPQADPNPLQRLSPLLVMMALGGKATKQDAGLMFAATNGAVQGYLQGDATKLNNSQKQYEEAYQQFKDRQEQQLKIYDTLKEAYQGRPDADLKALTMAHSMTGDDLKVDQDRLTAQQHFEAAAKKLADTNDAMAEKKWVDRSNFALRQKAADTKAKAAAQQAGASPDLSDSAKDMAASQYLRTGQLPSMGMSKNSAATRVDIMNRAAELAKANGDDARSVALKQAAAKAAVTAITDQTKFFSTVSALEGTASANLDLAVQEGRKLSASGSPLINRGILAWRQGVSGDSQTGRFVNALTAAKDEYAKVISGSTGSKGLTDAARRESNDMFSKVNSQETLEAQAAIAKQEMKNRTGNMQNQISRLRDQLAGSVIQKGGDTATPSNATKTVVRTGTLNGKKVIQYSDGTTSYAQ